MMENNYASNSHKSREEQAASEGRQKLDKVVTGTAKTRKKNDIRKFADVFISEDAKNVKQYVLMDIVVPTIKKAIIGANDMILNGGNSTVGGHSTTSKVSYRKYYDEPRSTDRYRQADTRPRTRFDHEDIVFESRGEAEAVLVQMGEVIDIYGFVTVADMYDLAGLTEPYTANKYGWTNIRSAEIVRINGGGYVIKLPKASPIDY